MSEAVLQSLFERGRLWRGQGNVLPHSALPTGFASLDAVLPGGGWPTAALSEILLPADGVGEWHTLWPLLARLSVQGGRIALVAPPYIPFAPAWAAAGIALPQLQIVQTDDDRNAMWVAEQCLRSAACAAVVCWPRQGDARTLRRLQFAAETGQCLGFAMRPANVSAQPSMAALRILIEVDPPQWRVLKCRGGNPPTRAVPLPSTMLSRAAPPSPPSKADEGEETELQSNFVIPGLPASFADGTRNPAFRTLGTRNWIPGSVTDGAGDSPGMTGFGYADGCKGNKSFAARVS